MDADDAFHPQRLEILLSHCRPDLILIDQMVEWRKPFGRAEWQPLRPSEAEDEPERIKAEDRFVRFRGSARPFFHKSLLESGISYDERFVGGSDTQFVLEMVESNPVALAHVAEPLYRYRIHGASATSSKVRHLDSTILSRRASIEALSTKRGLVILLEDDTAQLVRQRSLYAARGCFADRKFLGAIEVIGRNPGALMLLPRMALTKADLTISALSRSRKST